MNKWLVGLVTLATVVSSTAALADGDAKAGEAKSAVCMACHGPGGNSVNPIWPKLAGQHQNYIRKQLEDFKASRRANELMSPQAAALQPNDVDDLAAYFSSQTQSDAQSADLGKVKKGTRIYMGGNAATGTPACSGCHGPQGMGNELAKFPRISGQHTDYIVKALKDFRAGNRANDPNGMMRGVVRFMTDDEIDAVAHYVQGLY